MKLWTPHHRTLLNALRADPLVDKLIRRLSLERCRAHPDDPGLLRDWVICMREDPGWQHIADHLDRPRAWPGVWRRAVQAGWSPRTDHHHALLFGRFCDELVASFDLEAARYAWAECIDAWMRVFDADYVDRLLDDLSASDSQTRQTLLRPLVDRRAANLRRALAIGEPDPAAQFDRRRTRFGWHSLDVLDRRLSQSDLAHPILGGLRGHLDTVRNRLTRQILAHFRSLFDGVDLGADDPSRICQPLEWMQQVFSILPIDPTVASRVASATVTLGWRLRKLDIGRADDLLERLLSLARPFNDKLAEFIDDGEAFGHNSTCADFLVFQGEHQDDDARRQASFRRARQVCPGHRNASMMMSYEKLRQVNQLLVGVRFMPAAVRMVPGAPGRVDSLIADARQLLDEAERIYPSNDAIAEYRQELVTEAERLGAERPE